MKTIRTRVLGLLVLAGAVLAVLGARVAPCVGEVRAG